MTLAVEWPRRRASLMNIAIPVMPPLGAMVETKSAEAHNKNNLPSFSSMPSAWYIVWKPRATARNWTT